MSGCSPELDWHSAGLCSWMGVVSTPAFQFSLNWLSFNVKNLQEVLSLIGGSLTLIEKDSNTEKLEIIGGLKCWKEKGRAAEW